MDATVDPVIRLLHQVRSRWRTLLALQSAGRGVLALACVTAMLALAAAWISGSTTLLAVLTVVALVLLLVVVALTVRASRALPPDAQVARFVEERQPALEARLVSAVHVLSTAESDRPTLSDAMLDDARRAVAGIDADAVISGERLRKAGFQLGGALALALVVVFVGRAPLGRSYDAVMLTLFPARVSLEVLPGNTRIEAGKPLTIQARLVGNRAPVVAQIMRVPMDGSANADPAAPGMNDSAWQISEMTTDAAGAFRFAMSAVDASFKYRVVAGTVTSGVFDVTVARPPRVTRIAVEYRYPRALGLAPHTDEDGGDIYAPPGTDIRLHVHTDRSSAAGRLKFADGRELALESTASSTQEGLLTAGLKVSANTSYRVALADPDGLTNPGETEYFIRTLDDRPPEVHVKKPARDRSVTLLEEVEIEAEASDDVAVDSFELVYAVGGTEEKVITLPIPQGQTSVSAGYTLYLEDFDVRVGDFVSYYLRARDRGRGKKPGEGRSDIFFLEVKPFEREFELARSQGIAAAGNRTMDDLIATQKEIIVATWKLDRRSQAADGARSEHDIRAVAKAEDDLKKRVEETTSGFRETNMRDPRGQGAGRGGQTAGQPRAGQLRPEEEAMGAAAKSMGAAVASLNRLKTNESISHEMEALNHLLKAQADVKRQQIARQQNGPGGNRPQQDMSSLFDRELKREQQTNYETPSSATQQRDNRQLADEIKELARRQDEINRRQEQSERLTADERKRELEKLSREQADLRQQVEDLARQAEQDSQNSQQGRQGGQGRQGRQGGQAGPGAQNAGRGQSGQLRAASEEMRGAAGELQRQDPRRANERGTRAAEQLRSAERQLRAAGGPDERRRALGEAQLEARQIADAERQIAEEINQLAQGAQGARGAQGAQGAQGARGAQGAQGSVNDALRRLAGEQERLADRARQVQSDLQEQAAALAGGPGDSADLQRAIGNALSGERQRTAERMQQNAELLRTAAGQGNEKQAADQAARAVPSQEAAAREMDSLADKLGAAQSPRDAEAKRLSDQRDRAQELRAEIDRLTTEMKALSQDPNASRSAQQAQGDSGRAGRGQSGTGGSGGDLDKLRREYAQRLQQAQQLLDQLRRDDPSFAQGGPGLTFEAQGMTLSAPGTEAFKQDFAKWEQLRQQATQMLDRAESSLSQRLQVAAAQEHLAATADDRAPAAYQQRVDDYFKALATGRPGTPVTSGTPAKR